VGGDAGGVILPQGRNLIRCLVIAGVDEIRGLAPAFGDEIPEGQHAGPDHKIDEFFFISHDSSNLLLVFFLILL